MKLSSIQLEHFRSFRKVRFSLPKSGLTYLTGRNLAQPELEGNGVGKSSLFEGVYWTLFGKTSRNLKAGSVANWKAPKGCRGVLLGEHLGRGVLIVRTWSPNKLTLNGEEVDQTTLEKRLGLAPDTFLYSWFFPQFSESFLDLRPEQKMTLLVDLLKLNVWDSASDLAKSESDELDQTIKEKEARAEEILSVLEELDYHDTAKKEKGWDSEHRTELKRAVLSLNRLQKTRGALPETLDGAKRKARILQEEYSDAKANLRQIEGSLAKLSPENTRCPTCGANLDTTHRRNEIAKCKRRQSKYELLADRKRDSFDRAERTYESLREQLDSLAKAKDEVWRLGKETNPYTEQRRALLRKNNKARIRVAKLSEELLTLYKDVEATKFWVKGFKDVRLLVVNSVISQLESEVNQTIHELGLEGWEVRFDVERENKSGGISRGFTTMILSPDNTEPVPWESWSGGERQRLKLAGMMGFANLINNMTGQNPNVEFWDEPSSWMSTKGIDQMLESLASRAERYGRCVIIADHRALGFGGFSKQVTVVKDRRGSYIEGSLRIKT